MPKGVHNGNRGGNHQKPLKERFDNSCQKGECQDGCWLWTGTQCGTSKKRYGVIRDNYKQKKPIEFHMNFIREKYLMG